MLVATSTGTLATSVYYPRAIACKHDKVLRCVPDHSLGRRDSTALTDDRRLTNRLAIASPAAIFDPRIAILRVHANGCETSSKRVVVLACLVAPRISELPVRTTNPSSCLLKQRHSCSTMAFKITIFLAPLNSMHSIF